MNPLVSIVIVNYNYGRFLSEAIQSIVLQDGFSECELIVIDGGSSDNSVDVIRGFEKSIAYWISEKDRGQSDAFNKGFLKARGQFGFWLNADDILMPGILRKIITFLKMDPTVEWLAGSCVYADVKLNVVKCSRCVCFPRWLGRLMPASPVNGPSAIFSLDRLRSVGGFDIGVHYVMDVDLWRRFYAAGMRLRMMKDYMWCFRLHESSKTAGGIIKRFDNGHGNSESLRINARYGVTPIILKMSNYVNKFFRCVSGMYLWSIMDTMKYRGRNVMEVV